MTKYRNVQEALYGELEGLLERGSVVESRAGRTLERTARRITLAAPVERFHLLPHRHANPFAQVAETLWVLGGRANITFLQPYLSHAPEFSDDGVTWRAGYGPRLRAYRAGYGDTDGPVDQVAEILRILHKDPGSRRAVISLFDPVTDFQESKDIPCNNWIQFLARDGVLNMHVVTRSNDVIWGWSGINTFEWSVLLEAVAADLLMSVGTMTFFAGSFHLYERHWSMARAIVDHDALAPSLYPTGEPSARITLPWAEFSNQLPFVLEMAEQLPAAALETLLRPMGRELAAIGLDSWLEQSLQMLNVYGHAQRRANPATLRASCEPLRGAALRVTVEWLERAGLLEDVGAGREAVSRPSPRVLDPSADVLDPPAASPGAKTDERGPVPDVPQSILPVANVLAVLEAKKSQSYGDSWKKHGELFSIVPNILRKADRLAALRDGATATTDEALVDTVADLAVYGIKYLGWQREQQFQRGYPDFATFTCETWNIGQSEWGAFDARSVCLTNAPRFTQDLEQLLYNNDHSCGEATFRAQRRDATQSLVYMALSWLYLTMREDPDARKHYVASVLAL